MERAPRDKRLKQVYISIHMLIIYMIHEKRNPLLQRILTYWALSVYRKQKTFPDPWGAPCNDVQMVAARCPMIRLKNYTDRKNIAFHLTLLSSCLDPVLHDIALFGSEFPNYFSTKLSCTFHKQNLWKFLGFICWKVSM